MSEVMYLEVNPLKSVINSEGFPFSTPHLSFRNASLHYFS